MSRFIATLVAAFVVLISSTAHAGWLEERRSLSADLNAAISYCGWTPRVSVFSKTEQLVGYLSTDNCPALRKWSGSGGRSGLYDDLDAASVDWLRGNVRLVAGRVARLSEAEASMAQLKIRREELVAFMKAQGINDPWAGVQQFVQEANKPPPLSVSSATVVEAPPVPAPTPGLTQADLDAAVQSAVAQVLAAMPQPAPAPVPDPQIIVRTVRVEVPTPVGPSADEIETLITDAVDNALAIRAEEDAITVSFETDRVLEGMSQLKSWLYVAGGVIAALLAAVLALVVVLVRRPATQSQELTLTLDDIREAVRQEVATPLRAMEGTNARFQRVLEALDRQLGDVIRHQSDHPPVRPEIVESLRSALEVLQQDVRRMEGTVRQGFVQDPNLVQRQGAELNRLRAELAAVSVRAETAEAELVAARVAPTAPKRNGKSGSAIPLSADPVPLAPTGEEALHRTLLAMRRDGTALPPNAFPPDPKVTADEEGAIDALREWANDLSRKPEPGSG